MGKDNRQTIAITINQIKDNHVINLALQNLVRFQIIDVQVNLLFNLFHLSLKVL